MSNVRCRYGVKAARNIRQRRGDEACMCAACSPTAPLRMLSWMFLDGVQLRVFVCVCGGGGGEGRKGEQQAC